MGASWAAMSLLAKTAVVSSIAGTAVATYGAVQQGKAADAAARSEQDILNYNAQLKEKEAEAEREAARVEAEQFQKEGRRLLASQKVKYARGGLLTTEGTPALVLEETAQELEFDRMQILKSGFLRASYRESEGYGMRYEGEAARARGKNLKRGSQLQAAGTLLGGMGKTASTYYQLKDK